MCFLLAPKWWHGVLLMRTWLASRQVGGGICGDVNNRVSCLSERNLNRVVGLRLGLTSQEWHPVSNDHRPPVRGDYYQYGCTWSCKMRTAHFCVEDGFRPLGIVDGRQLPTGTWDGSPCNKYNPRGLISGQQILAAAGQWWPPSVYKKLQNVDGLVFDVSRFQPLGIAADWQLLTGTRDGSPCNTLHLEVSSGWC